MSGDPTAEPSALPAATDRLCERHAELAAAHDDAFAAAKAQVNHLGAHVREDRAEFGIWTPDLLERGVPPEAVELELLTPPADLDPGETDPREVTFRRTTVPTKREGEVTWAAVEGAVAGTRERLGTLYRLVYDPADAPAPERAAEDPDDPDATGRLVPDADGLVSVTDPLADSMPFGAFAPPELYDRGHLEETRADREYFETLGSPDERVPTSEHDGLPRVDPATSMLEVHPGTATERGSLGGLADLVEELGRKQRAGESLTPFEETLAGYDAVQLMPVEPLTQRSDEPGDFRDLSRAADGETATATVARPAKLNWGYDVVVHGFGAPCPAVLESGRPDEFVDLLAAFHTLPEPVTVVLDVALGHADNGGLELLPSPFIHGPGMYGQHLDYLHPMVRAHVLDFQRRKMDWGADGIRVDGAQDFRNWNPETEEMEHDDAFLAEMDRVTHEVAGTEYRPWMVYEDGRPWPRHDWELASTYRTLIEQHPHAFQWSPLSFAHNKPAMLTFWAAKLWRIREVLELGDNWITGVANHDTLRRGTQVDVPESWEGDPINRYLGESPPEIIERAYDNPATNAFVHAFLPGVPMDFLNANARGPWGFVRDTDAVWNVKVVADEENLVDWQIRERDYADDRFFPRLKAMGFETRDQLDEFVSAMAATVEPTDYDLEAMAGMLSPLELALDPDAADLEAFADAWMRDVGEFANLGHWREDLDPVRTGYGRAVREFRQARPWLRASLREDDTFAVREPADGTVVYAGERTAPDGTERVLFVANMEGAATTVVPANLADADREAAGYEPALVPPAVRERAGDPAVDDPLELHNGEGVVFVAAE